MFPKSDPGLFDASHMTPQWNEPLRCLSKAFQMPLRCLSYAFSKNCRKNKMSDPNIYPTGLSRGAGDGGQSLIVCQYHPFDYVFVQRVRPLKKQTRS